MSWSSGAFADTYQGTCHSFVGPIRRTFRQPIRFNPITDMSTTTTATASQGSTTVASTTPSSSSSIHTTGNSSSSSSYSKKQIPRPRNAWIIYRADALKDLLEREPELRGTPQAEMSKMLAKMWKEESPEIRHEYELRASLEKEEHEKNHPDYTFRPMKKADKQSLRKQKKDEKDRVRVVQRVRREVENQLRQGFLPPEGVTQAELECEPTDIYDVKSIDLQFLMQCKFGGLGPSPPMSECPSSTGSPSLSRLTLDDDEGGSLSRSPSVQVEVLPSDPLHVSDAHEVPQLLPVQDAPNASLAMSQHSPVAVSDDDVVLHDTATWASQNIMNILEEALSGLPGLYEPQHVPEPSPVFNSVNHGYLVDGHGDNGAFQESLQLSSDVDVDASTANLVVSLLAETFEYPMPDMGSAALDYVASEIENNYDVEGALGPALSAVGDVADSTTPVRSEVDTDDRMSLQLATDGETADLQVIGDERSSSVEAPSTNLSSPSEPSSAITPSSLGSSLLELERSGQVQPTNLAASGSGQKSPMSNASSPVSPTSSCVEASLQQLLEFGFGDSLLIADADQPTFTFGNEAIYSDFDISQPLFKDNVADASQAEPPVAFPADPAFMSSDFDPLFNYSTSFSTNDTWYLPAEYEI